MDEPGTEDLIARIRAGKIERFDDLVRGIRGSNPFPDLN